MLLPGECAKRRARLDARAFAARESYAENPGPRKQAASKWTHKNADRVRSQQKRYRQLKANDLRQYASRWRKTNRPWRQAYEKQRRNDDVDFKLCRNLRKRLHHAIRGTTKSSRTEDLLGCSFTFLRFWLESKFLPNMSWENYGDWHVDHIRPLASFDLTDPKQQALAFHFLNLQPLWAKDNLSKGAKILDTCDPNGNGNAATVESHGQLL